MAFSLDEFFRESGTRFLLHPQAPLLEDFREPETVWVSSPAGTLREGPSDDRMFTIAPIEKTPYTAEDIPPFDGDVHPKARPGADGHFDHLKPGTSEFLCAHMFGSIRRVLDIWEIYAGGPVPWHFQSHHSKLELVAHVPWRNAQFGWGFCECGEDKDDHGTPRPFALNFDILAHEVGHGLLFSMTGLPSPEGLTTDYLGFHESSSDLVAIISSLHFDSFVDHVLTSTMGDLYIQNELNRIGELSGTRQIRSASNSMTMDAIDYREKKPMDLSGHQVHELGQPLTGAFFDISVEFFVRRLVYSGAVSAANAEQVRRVSTADDLEGLDPSIFPSAYSANPTAFTNALKDARDMLGLRLARSWHLLRPNGLRFEHVAEAFLAADHRLTGDRYQGLIRDCFVWRGILT